MINKAAAPAKPARQRTKRVAKPAGSSVETPATEASTAGKPEASPPVSAQVSKAETIREPAPVAAPAKEGKDKKKVKAKEKVKEKDKDKDKRKKKKKKKEAVLIRFDDDQLPLIAASADALGLSRAAWVRMVVAKALTRPDQLA